MLKLFYSHFIKTFVLVAAGVAYTASVLKDSCKSVLMWKIEN